MVRTNIPRNSVSFDYEGILSNFISSIVRNQKDNVISIFLTGSYSRGDATESSDVDLWCVFRKIDSQVLSDVRLGICEALPMERSIELNPQCLSVQEFESDYFTNWTERPIKVLDAVLLYGDDLVGDRANVSEVELLYKRYLADILLSIRHYICANESMEELTYQKIKTHILKPLMFSLRLERWCTCGFYPLSNDDLRRAYDNPIFELVEYFLNPEKCEDDMCVDHRAVLYKMHDLVAKLLV